MLSENVRNSTASNFNRTAVFIVNFNYYKKLNVKSVCDVASIENKDLVEKHVGT